MRLSEKLVRGQLEILKPLITGASLQAARLGQNALGMLAAKRLRRKVTVEIKDLGGFRAAWITSKNQRANQVILYLHGGGYVAGGIDHAKGYGSVLAAQNSIAVLCPAYRLAPEHPFPAAPDDAMTAYQYLLDQGYRSSQIVLCGESAGGGLVFSLCLQCKAMGIPLPCGIVAISPWTDLTLSGRSYEKNRECDPSMTMERLQYYVSCYTEDVNNPLASPLFGDLTGFPPVLMFAGGDEIMLDDAVVMNQKLRDAGNQSGLVISPKMWHAYILYGLEEKKADVEKITHFIKKVLYEQDQTTLDEIR